jgi:hypothetical protein
VTTPGAAASAWPSWLSHDELHELQFCDFRGGTIDDVVAVLHHNEPQFMAALEADVAEHGVGEPVELGHGDTIMQGHHRIAAAYVTGRDCPVAFYGEDYPRDEEAERRWDELRRSHPEEHQARMDHDPRHWERPAEHATGIEAA